MDEYILSNRVYYNVHIADNQQETNITYPHGETVSNVLYGLAMVSGKCGNVESLEANNLSIKGQIHAYRCHNATMSEQISSLDPNEG
ncbi:hypothetical protein [Pectobacterium carotovorum]|uniref:hypothetical protein n=1 Tax=Pectobacterium carotovorum TaxID=554 RepID=UPI002116A566|nr:hypothetical protein [Pectobacterium carotovorum]MCQ8233320.1 hypothetical protein [Pectobacterium carotovorum]